MNKYKEKPSNFPWPLTVFVSAIFLSIILQQFLLSYWFAGPIAEFLFGLGLVIFFIALAFIFSAIRTLYLHKTTVSPMKGANHLVTNGVFAISRNPIYLGFATAMIGLSLIMANLWCLVLMFPAAFIVQKLSIEPEEFHLQQRFGRKWRDYSRKVRRWF